MNGIPCVQSQKEALQEALTQEVALLRNLLTSLHDECNAIKSQDEWVFDQVMEERITLISRFEKWSSRVILITIDLATSAEVPLRDAEYHSHSEAIELLQGCLDSNDFELLYLREQVLAIVSEIHQQNAVNAGLLKDGVPQGWYERIEPENAPLPKCVVSVIEKSSSKHH